MLPVCIAAYVFLPKTWGGDIAMACIFGVMTIAIFLFMPKLVGEQYKDEVYKKFITVVKQKFSKK